VDQVIINFCFSITFERLLFYLKLKYIVNIYSELECFFLL